MALVEDLGTTTQELNITSTRTNRQTEEKSEIKYQFKMTCTNGIMQLEMNNKPVTKSKLHQLKGHVIKEVLVNLCGYINIDQNVDKLKLILYSLCGIEEDPRTVFEKLFDEETKGNIVELLESAKMMIAFDLFYYIKDHGNKDADKSHILSITSFVWDVYVLLHIEFGDALDRFIEYIWNQLINTWVKYPTDCEFTDEMIAIISLYHESEEYIELEKAYKHLQNSNELDCGHKEMDFCSFAYPLYVYIEEMFIKEVCKLIMDVLVRISPNYNSGKKLNDDELYYLHQSMGGATANSLLRVYYGGNFACDKKQMLISIIRSMLYNSDIDNMSDSKIAYRIQVENRGGYRILTQTFTTLVGKIMSEIEPELNNIVLVYKGNFNVLLQTLIAKEQFQKEFHHLFNSDIVLNAFQSKMQDTEAKRSDEDEEFESDEDIDIDIDISSDYARKLYTDCLHKVYLDFMKGLFNRSIWGYLKQLRPTKDSLSLRNKLRVSLTSLNKQYSSLQIDTD
eukprot:172320_1